ncbi:MAG TPA: hypothetical protein DEP57_01885 [Selenomonas sp.]|nr:hypothetical protein [Selenomonas sp.]
MNEVVALDQLATEIRYYSQQASWSIIEIGKRLIEAKKQVAEGDTWEKWLKDNVNFTIRTAQRFMKCAERFGEATMSSHLNPSQMMELLSLPAADTEKFMEEKEAEGNPVADMTIKNLRKEIKEWKSKAEQAKNEAFAAANDKRRAELRAEQVERSNETLRNQCDAQAKEIQDLKDNPTVVETPADPEYIAQLKDEAAKAKAQARKANLDFENLQDALEKLDKRGGDAIRERDKYAQMAEEIAGELKQAQELNARLLAERKQSDAETDIAILLATATRQINDENLELCVRRILRLNDGEIILRRFKEMADIACIKGD